MTGILDIILHIDERILYVVQTFGPWAYLLLWLVVFCETGLLIFPFLPGDSLLFAAGLLSNPEHRTLNFAAVCAVFISAAIIGDSVNYVIGRFVGDQLFKPHKSPILNRMFRPSHLQATQAYFDRYGPRTVIIGRFIPIVRTLTPFVAGKTMAYRKFLIYSVTGTLLWVGICAGSGYLFGQLPVVKENFSIAILVVAGGTFLMGAAEVFRNLRKNAKEKAQAAAAAETENTA